MDHLVTVICADQLVRVSDKMKEQQEAGNAFQCHREDTWGGRCLLPNWRKDVRSHQQCVNLPALVMHAYGSATIAQRWAILVMIMKRTYQRTHLLSRWVCDLGLLGILCVWRSLYEADGQWECCTKWADHCKNQLMSARSSVQVTESDSRFLVPIDII